MSATAESGPRGREERTAVSSRAAFLDGPLTSYHLVLGTTVLLTALGLVMVLSASSVEALQASGSAFSYVRKQAMWVVMGVPLMWLAARLPVRAYRVFAYPALLVSLALLVLVLVPGIGKTVNGNQNWIDFGGPFSIQPSEPAKLALIVWGADLLARKQRMRTLTRWRHLVVPLVPVAFLVVGMVVLGGDLGTALVLMAILMTLLFVVGAPMRLFVGVGGLLAALVTALVLMEPYRVTRVRTFLDPFADYEGAGWQAAHSIFALSTGGWWGVGLGASREKWGTLPEAHTDFIFAIIGEELGLVGTLAVLALFAAFTYAGVRLATRTRDPFVRLATAGIVAWLCVQAFVNIGAVVGVLPITGIPLPLVSYGGSAMLPTMTALGILLAFARREPDARAALAARAPGPLARARRRRRDARAD
jgi:cell division protein FtsW